MNQDGSAEFNNVTIRGGQVVGGTALYYNGTPAAGNLIMSISASAGTDPYGNSYVAGVGVYGASDKVTVRNTGGDTAVLRADAPSGIASTPGPGLALSMASGDAAAGSLTEWDDGFKRGVYLRTSSPVADPGASEGEDYAAVRMSGRFHGADPAIDLEATGPTSTIAINSTIFGPTGEMQVYNGSQWTSFNPILTPAGGAPTSTKVGYWRRWGDDIEFVAYFVFSGAGAGATPLTFQGPPVEIDRSARQWVGAHLEAMAAGNSGMGCVLAFVSGSGSVWDRLRNPSNTTLTGADLLAGSIITIKGTYRALV
ncbi:hypothetical protein ACIPWE_40275 [Streptomyces sp. NPDC090073]|uniref:hypothetical protein n=1 Tax=Streptomyces sp. NPDC090073 TaxID=3365936 RepID=UPI003801B88C